MKNAGQTLMEIIIVIGVVVILSTGLVILSTTSLSSSRVGTIRSQAVKYAAEGMEFVRQKRDENWTDFKTLVDPVSENGIWCLDDGGSWTQEQAPICLRNVKHYFSRGAEFSWDDANQRMKVTVSVKWYEGNGYYATQLDSYFTDPSKLLQLPTIAVPTDNLYPP